MKEDEKAALDTLQDEAEACYKVEQEKDELRLIQEEQNLRRQLMLKKLKEQAEEGERVSVVNRIDW